MKIKPQLKPFLPLSLSLMLAVVLVILVEDFVQTVIVRPLLYTVWFVTLILQSFPQGLIWTVFLFLMFAWTFNGLSKWQATQRAAWRTLPPTTGQVERWVRRLGYAQANPLSKWRLAQELKRLHRKLQTPVDGNGGLPDTPDSLDLSEEIAAYFAAAQPSQPTPWQRIFHPEEETNSALELDPEIAIAYLEKIISDGTK